MVALTLTLLGTTIALVALIIQIIVWRTARTDQILAGMLAEMQRFNNRAEQ